MGLTRGQAAALGIFVVVVVFLAIFLPLWLTRTDDATPSANKKNIILEEYPFRNPIALTKAIAKYTKGKHVADLGCGAGDLLYSFEGVKSRIGYEIDMERYMKAKNNGRDAVKRESFLTTKFPPDVNVFFIWVPVAVFEMFLDTKNRIPPGAILIDGTSDIISTYSVEIRKKINEQFELLEEILYQFDDPVALDSWKSLPMERYVRVYQVRPR